MLTNLLHLEESLLTLQTEIYSIVIFWLTEIHDLFSELVHRLEQSSPVSLEHQLWKPI